MPSPFPGMDPYIEQPWLWPDFHNSLTVEIRSQMNRLIRPRYVAHVDTYITYEVVEIGRTSRASPDISVWRREVPTAETRGGVATITPAPATSVLLERVPLRLSRVKIRSVERGQLVTLIEILSPANKRPGQPAFDDYRKKRRRMLRSAISIVEIDLLRGGERLPLAKPVATTPYCAFLCRVNGRPNVEVWPIGLRDELPMLPVPLAEPDPDVPLDLAAAVATVYEQGAYDVVLDYTMAPPPPALSPSDAVWVDELLRNRRERDPPVAVA